jgi:putative transposase
MTPTYCPVWNWREKRWVLDITYVKTIEGYSYLSLITEAYSHKIVGYTLHPNLESIGCLEALAWLCIQD